MKYYKVKPEYDNKTIFKCARGGGLKIDGFLIGNELLTETEYKKRLNRAYGYINCFDVVNINKNKTYWFFGARFAE